QRTPIHPRFVSDAIPCVSRLAGEGVFQAGA
ncbi:hypothetical protein QF017_001829, partial [Pseudomonas laurylsulfatiphila]